MCSIISILLADDHELMRKGLRTLLENEKDFEVVAEAQTGRQAVDMIREHKPQVVVMDVTMPDMNGITATKHITSEFTGIKVLGLSMHPTEVVVGEMFKAGASGYLTKNCAAAELVEAIRVISGGELYISQEFPRAIVQKHLERGNKCRKCVIFEGLLSERERQVLQLVAEGKPSKAIAGKLFISEKTVGVHRQNLMKKLNMRSVAELTKFAIREGLTPLD